MADLADLYQQACAEEGFEGGFVLMPTNHGFVHVTDERLLASVSVGDTDQDTFLVASDEGERYKQLRRALESQLRELRILRLGSGEVKVDIYLIGRTRSGDWAGLHTTSVET